ncbi:helix-turn-helix domain-containing protein [Escherichia coli]|uniref:helix-turn-helix domain-containing protein n=3 Tax=Escherichia coli TaxID=562 RepID=UPI003BF7C85F
MSHIVSVWRELCDAYDRLQQRVDNINKVITTMNQQFIPKIHDRMAALERHVKKFDPMLERWENGYLVRTRVVRQRVEVPVAVDSGEHDDVSSQWRRVRRIDYATYQEVMRLTEEGLGIHRIGKRLGISPQTVSNTRKMPPERVEKLRQLSQGDSGVDGGERKDEVNESKPQKRTPVDYALYQEVMRLTEEGLGIHRISKALGISKQTVINIRKMPPERIEHLQRVHEGLPSIYKSSGKRAATIINKEELHKILEVQKRTPDISMIRLSALTGITMYRLKKYLALSDAERDALLEALDEDE